jgi:acetolactate synthase-1/2/3 large subunit
MFVSEVLPLFYWNLTDPSSVGYPGGAVLPLFDAMFKSSLFHFILAHHEQGAGHMAEGFASASLKPGVVMVTSGPGSSNLVTPMLNALLDGTPMVVICGQVSTTVRGTSAFQEIDIMEIARTCTKWSACVERVGDLPKIMKEAFHQATFKRPGPVLVAVPMDIGTAVVHEVSNADSLSRPLRSEEYAGLGVPANIDNRPSLQHQIDQIAKMVKNSQRPVICAGHGVNTSEAGPEVLSRIAEKSKIPVMTTLLGLGCFDESHDLALHMVGTYGAPYANYAIQKADLILVLGARLDDRVVGEPAGFAPKAKEAGQLGRGGIVHFDLNPSTVGKIIEPTQIIIGDLSESLPILLGCLNEQQSRDEWLDQIQQWKKQHAFQVPQTSRQSRATPQQAITELYLQTSLSKNCTTLTTGVGQHQMWAAQRYRYKTPCSFITSGSLGTMGFGLPAAIGAQIARPDHTVIDIDGDASFCMTMEELLTASQYNIPIKVVIFNNNTQGMIAQIQRSGYGGRVCYNCQANPDFVQLAHAMGCESQRCRSLGELRGCIRWLLERRKPALLDILMDEAEMLPIVPNGKALDLISLEKCSRG